MKKRNFITGFSAAFVALIALASCGGVRAKDGVVLTINGKEYTAKELYEDQKTPAAAEAKFNAVYKVAVRRYFESGQEGNTYMSEITRDTKLKIAGAKAEAQSNADKNGTSYDTEWDKILSTNGVENESELYDKFEYDLEKTKFEDVFYSKKIDGEKTNYDILREGGYFDYKEGGKEYGSKINGYFAEKQPYHMKHILVKIAGGKTTDDTLTEITREEALKIYKVVTQLAKGTSFEDVASMINDDDTAKANKGSLGIMSRDTSFVNDFKLGVYLYEAVYGSSTSTNTEHEEKGYKSKKAVKELFGVDSLSAAAEGTAGWYANKIITELNDPSSCTQEGVASSLAIGKIPYGEILKFGDSDSETTGLNEYDSSNQTVVDRFTAAGLSKDDAKAKYFPRNVIFNKYFNKHNIMVITPDDAPDYNVNENNKSVYFKQETSGSQTKTSMVTTVADKHLTTSSSTHSALSGFSYTDKEKNDDKVMMGTNKQNVLRDNNGRVVLVFRSGTGSSSSEKNAESSYQGIHFVVIERSPFIGREYDDNPTDPSTSTMYTDLNEYYTQYYPGETDHPKYNGTKTEKYTFTNYFKNEPDVSKLKARADTVKSELKKADDNLNTYIYDYLIAKGQLTFASTTLGDELKETINSWISITKREEKSSIKEKDLKWNNTWRDYYIDLMARKERRGEVDSTGSTKYSSLVPEICVDAFTGKTSIKKSSTADYALNELFGSLGAFHE